MSEFRSYTTEEAKVSETKSENFLEKYLKGSRREIALGLGALIISLSGSAIAKERHEEDSFDELDAETEAIKVTKEDVKQARSAFERDVEISLAKYPTAKENVKQSLSSTLDKLTKLEDQIEAIRIFQEQLDARKAPQSYSTESIIERSQQTHKETNKGIDAFKDFLSETNSFSDVVRELIKAIPDGKTVEYNGVVLSRKGVDILYEGKKVTESSRIEILKAYQAVREKMKKIGAEL